jgi:hypothetical protein
LCIAASTGWARSYFRADIAILTKDRLDVAFYHSAGCFALLMDRYPISVGTSFTYSPEESPWSRQGPSSRAAFVAWNLVRFYASTNATGFVVELPYWVLLAPCLVPVGIRLLRRRRRERAENACPRCGYDLRATPDRCPECGTAPAPGNVPPRSAVA